MRLLNILWFFEAVFGGVRRVLFRVLRRAIEDLEHIPPNGFVARQGTEFGSWVYQ